MKYLLSVITPCFNADIPMLERAFKSLRDQTLGFENIEWIIVSHNSAGETTERIIAMTNTYQNVSVHVLKDENKTPSAPRNYGLGKASGDYIGFLDADDWFEPEVFKEALGRIQETDAEIAAFHFRSASAGDDIQTVPPFTLLDQTVDVIVAERENRDSRMFTHIMGLVVWSKVFKRDFLEKHGLRFDNDVPFTEDALFNIECFNKAKRICFLPRLIGYNYFLRGSSITQNINKTPDEVVRIAGGMAKTFERGLTCGLYMTGFIWGCLCFEAALLLASENLTMSERRAVFAILSPYLKTEKMEIDYAQKSYGNDGKTMRKFPKAVIGHPRFTHCFVSLMKALNVDLASKLKSHQQY